MYLSLSLIALLSLNEPNEPRPAIEATGGERVLTAQDELNAALLGITAPPRSTKDELLNAVQTGNVWLKMRYRFENASQNRVMKEGYASTLRTILGYETGSWNDFSATVEFEDVSPINDDSYNSTTNGKVDRAVIADPDVSEVNQVFLQYKVKDRGRFRLGRQRIVLGNSRFIGNVGWRQNEQTYNGASGSWDLGCGTNAFYAFLTNVNDVKGGDWRMHSHLLHVTHDVPDVGELSVYGYRVNFDMTTGNEASTNTIGTRFTGESKLSDANSIVWSGEYANQDAAGQNKDTISAHYIGAEAGWKSQCGTFALGYEMLGGNGIGGEQFQTPLATLHKFNGWADKFLQTPSEGLTDLYWSYGTTVGRTKIKAVYHDFEADHGNLDFGSELDLDAVFPVCENMAIGARYANYMAKDNSTAFNLTDTNKFWFWMSFWI